MIGVERTERGLFASWWWTVDRLLFGAVIALALVGVILVFAASPPVAERIGAPPLHFVRRHLAFLVPAALLLLGCSLLNQRGVRRLSLALLGLSLAGILATLLIGIEIKGAQRWLTLAGFNLQPSEFAKPALSVVAAWLLTNAGGLRAAVALYAVVVALLALQPDIGMAAVVVAVAGVQLFVAGMPWRWLCGLVATGILAAWQAYALLPHVASRIDRFLNPEAGDAYQVTRAMEALKAGGLAGRGPGEGVAKYLLPDAHSDFIFAAAAEEFGLLAGLGLISLFAFIMLRGLWRAAHARDRFAQLAATGLLAQFGLQAVINMGVNLHLLPTKGMTLPFISYGGSSLCALAITIGMALALTRRRSGGETT